MRFVLISFLFVSCFLVSNEIRYSSEPSSKLYLNLDTSNYQKYLELYHQEDKTIEELNGFSIVKANKKDIDLFSKYMHEELHICGGFQTSFNYESARSKVLDRLEREDSSNMFLLETDVDQAALVNAATPLVQASRIEAVIKKLESFYSREFRSSMGVDSSEWIMKSWRNILKTRDDAEVNLFQHSWSQPSVYAKIKGASDSVIIIGGHLDSKNYGSASGRAPGADDDASGIAVITEVMRVLVESNYTPDNTLIFVGYSAEEEGLLGSEDFANFIFDEDVDVLGVMQIDMALHNSAADGIALFTTDTSAVQRNFVQQLITDYSGAAYAGTTNCGNGCSSDHASWVRDGTAYGVYPFEAIFGNHNSSIHTANDTFEFGANNINLAVSFAKLGVAYMIESDK